MWCFWGAVPAGGSRLSPLSPQVPAVHRRGLREGVQRGHRGAGAAAARPQRAGDGGQAQPAQPPAGGAGGRGRAGEGAGGPWGWEECSAGPSWGAGAAGVLAVLLWVSHAVPKDGPLLRGDCSESSPDGSYSFK